jgi:tRNA(fMet)-specific endonuclease VapC
MSGDLLLLDTNIVSALLDGDPAVTSQNVAGTVLFIPSTVVGELYYGAAKSGRPAENVRRLESFLNAAAIVSTDADTGRFYGQLKFDLRSAGTPIPENDVWIAAAALRHGMSLVTRDAHFTVVPGLSLVAW